MTPPTNGAELVGYHLRGAHALLGRAEDYLYGDHSGDVDAHTAGIGFTSMANAHAILALVAAIAEVTNLVTEAMT